MLKYGLIGSGMMGQEHIRNVALVDGVEIAAIFDPDAGMRREAA
ncbi:MAG: gfo/Idh/MocA family oxidoreductase, partial [Rhodobacter sp.]|nr:gfo/Idh/MocA family oxidoreductase [Rhodobacter sp.]